MQNEIKKKKRVHKKRWAVNRLEVKEVELSNEEYKKMIEILGDVIYHEIRRLNKNKINSDKSTEFCEPETLGIAS